MEYYTILFAHGELREIVEGVLTVTSLILFPALSQNLSTIYSKSLGT